MANGLYNLIRFVLQPVFKLVYPSRTYGLENLPQEGSFILCLNHCSALDPLYICAHIPKDRTVHFLAKKELFANPLLGKVMRAIHAIPVDRGNADLSAVRASMQVLKDGESLGIFPQGTRSRDNSPTPMMSGASMIALRAGVPVIPAYIDGPYRPFKRMDVRLGAPLDFSDFGRRCDKDTLDAATRRIADAVWSLQNLSRTQKKQIESKS